jgi:two-component sensor histidine kinase
MIVNYSALTDLSAFGQAGAHTCHFYDTTEDLVGCVVPFLLTGIERGERCVWVTGDPLDTMAARAAMAAIRPDVPVLLASGQLEILARSEWYGAAGGHDSRALVAALLAREADALAAGHPGLRFTADTPWVQLEEFASFPAYERHLRDSLAHRRITCLSTYCLDRCSGAAVLDAVNTHDFAIVRRNGVWSVIENTCARQELAERLASKETLLNEIHHRVKNNLQIVGSLLFLKARNFAEPAARQAVDDTLNRIHAMGLIHEMLYRETSGHDSIDFAEYVTALTEHLVFAYGEAGRITATLDNTTDAGQAMVPLEMAVPLGIAVAEALTNAIKHAFPAGRTGRITVTLSRRGAELAVLVEDDGRGLPPPHGDAGHNPGAGLTLIRGLMAQVGGTLEVGASALGGASLAMRLAL